MQTVLIAEDSPPRRLSLSDALERAGYLTIPAETAQGALGVLRALHVDLLLTRERLADVEGTTLAAIARHRGLDELVVVVLAEDEQEASLALCEGVVDAVLGRHTEAGSVVRLVRRLLRPVSVRPPAPIRTPAAPTTACAFPRA